MWVSKGRMRILDIDLENRPLSYLGNDWTSAEITAVAWAWIDDEPPIVETLLLQPDGMYQHGADPALFPETAFSRLAGVIASADVITGHYLRKHDLPMLNSAMLENGLPPLGEFLVQDTKCDLVKRKDFSASQENLASALHLSEAKHHMTQTEWRKANRLTPEGIEATHKRVVDDVLQHIALRRMLIERHFLKPPQRWSS